jgi:hypothetical protein
MFRQVAITTLVLTVAAIAVHALIARGRNRTGMGVRTGGPLVRLARAAAVILVSICMLGLAITGFYARLAEDAALSGYLLILHVSFGGVFIAALAALGVVSAWDHLPAQGRWIRTGAFWLMLTAAVTMTLAILLNMFPAFGIA